MDLTDILVFWSSSLMRALGCPPYSLSVPAMSTKEQVDHFLAALSDRFDGHLFSLDEDAAVCLDGERLQLSVMAASRIINACQTLDRDDVKRELFLIYVDEIEQQLAQQVQ